MEKKLRAKLEDELKELRALQQGEDHTGAQRRFPHGSDNLEELRRKFSESEEKVGRLFQFLLLRTVMPKTWINRRC